MTETTVVERDNLPLITKYRPKTFEEVIGHETTMKSIRSGITSNSCPHTFIFTGPAGLGKTTFARIIAKAVGCEQIEEINAGVEGGVDNIRKIAANSSYFPQFGTAKAYIVDECQVLSKTAFDALLKDTEEPPDHLFWFFLTTEDKKLTDAIKTRAAVYKLKRVEPAKLFPWLVQVAKMEEINLKPEFIFYIASNSGGSPRQCLSNLSKCRVAETIEEVVELVSAFDVNANDDDPGVVSVARLMMKRVTSLRQYQDAIKDIKNFSGAKKTFKGYFTSVMNNPQNNDWVSMAIIADSVDKMSDFPDNAFDIYLALYRCFGDWKS